MNDTVRDPEPTGTPDSPSPSRAGADPEDTPGLLLEAGRALFARRGYDGASIRAITREAGTNLGAVTYHFGSKRALYEAVLESVLRPLADRVAEATCSAGTATDRAEAVVRAFFAHLAEHPDQPHLMLQEITAGREPPEVLRHLLRRTLGELRQVILDGQAEGEIREGDPLLLAMSVVSQPVHMTLARHFTRSAVGLDPTDPGTRERMIEHAVSFVRAGLRPPSEAIP